MGAGTHDVVVLAADGLGRALVAGADADDGDRGAVEPDKRVDALEDDAEQAEQERHGGVAGLQEQTRGTSARSPETKTEAREGRTLWTWSQHWIGPVEQVLPVGVAGAVTVTVVGSPPGMAAARTVSAKRK